MRRHVLVVLKTSPNKLPTGPEREAMFKGHFANINRLSTERKLLLAGPSTAWTAGAACSSRR